MARSKTRESAAVLTDEQIAREDEFLDGLPRVNIGAFLLPPIWGPAHGLWVTILFYPAWLFADNLFFAAYYDPTPLSVTLAIIVGIVLFGVTLAFAIVSQPIAAHRAENLGVSRETYLRRERYWAIGCIIGGAVMIAIATYYNVTMRTEI